MSIELDVLVESYSVLKEYVPSRDRQAAADHLVGNIIDIGLSDSDLKKFAATDAYLRRAMEDYLDDFDDSDDDDYDDYDD
jgi:hypothetical protein